MKCQNCGKNEVNFRYSSNISGCVTETHLCSECAARSGYDSGRIFNAGSFFGGFMPMFGFNAFEARPQVGILQQNVPVTPVVTVQEPDIDNDMKARRELNALREQMRAAAEAEDFEKAAELRDKIKQMESDA